VVARHLKDQAHSSCEVHEHVGEGNGLDGRCGNVPSALSWSMQFNPVRLREQFIASTLIWRSLPASMFRGSTHAFGLNEAVELSRALKQLPSNFIIYGIEGQNFDTGSSDSPPLF
jgi:hydrogenase maturation protease